DKARPVNAPIDLIGKRLESVRDRSTYFFEDIKPKANSVAAKDTVIDLVLHIKDGTRHQLKFSLISSESKAHSPEGVTVDGPDARQLWKQAFTALEDKYPWLEWDGEADYQDGRFLLDITVDEAAVKQMHDPYCLQEFALNLELRHASFNEYGDCTASIKDIPVCPANERTATHWALARLVQSITDDQTNDDYQQLCAAQYNAFERFDIDFRLPDQAACAEQCKERKLTKQYWHLQSPLDWGLAG
ncbi:MAG: hypothetical protein K0U36_03280, partial [Alphaproteobacteria bacterium]|nr:hypothetical protein [Alphaproteobacteria bacterium]